MRLGVVVVGVLVVLAGCSGNDRAPSPVSSSRSETAPPVAVGPADWPTYHHDNKRTGLAPQLAPVGRLDQAWQATLDGAVYGQPLLVGGRLIAATEQDTVYALDPANGQVLWTTSLGEPIALSELPCGNIDPLGITGTTAYDPGTGLIFVVAETSDGTHSLAGIDLVSGAVVLRRALPPPQGDEIAHQQRAALTVLDGWVYVAYGGLAGDCGDYIGSVVAAPTAGTGPLRSYAVPTTREAGIWAPSGGTVLNGRLLYAAGNGESTQQYDFSDSVLELTPELSMADSFSPAQWAADNEADLDLGSMGPVAIGSLVLAIGKSGIGYLLDDTHLGGVGGQLASQQICGAYGGSAVVGSTVFVPCNDGARAVSVDPTNGLRVLWHSPVPANGSPVIGGGAVWVTDSDHGTLYALDPATGQPLDQLATGDLPHFASPTLGGNRAYLGTLHGVIAVGGA
jgi:polyvinyl alcohol dehydrogenase (cytochrome)